MPERPFSFSLYCGSKDHQLTHARAPNLRIGHTFLHGYWVLDTREILLGLTLASRDPVPDPGGVIVLVLAPVVG